MTAQNHRYSGLPTLTWTRPDGQMVSYRARRFLPQQEGQAALAEVTVQQNERLDLVAHRALGDSQSYWRLVDSAEVLWAEELEQTGVVLRVILPGFGG